MAGRVILLLLLIIILSVGGIIWFDFLNVIDAKTVLAPIYNYIPFLGDGRTQPKIADDEDINLNDERLAIRLEALALQSMELEIRQRDMDNELNLITQMNQELEAWEQRLHEQELYIRIQGEDAENKDRNVDQLARYLTGMPPQNAVGILANYEDQIAIDVIRKTEDIARAEGAQSIVAFWFSLMEPARAAELQRKMAGRPPSL
ncbi:MAG: flagellar protein FlbB [Treponema sp.]|nr:flagellar protein FlbB [Treponema sp.]